MEVKIVSNSGIDIHNQTDIMRILDPVILIHAMFRVVLTFCWIQVVPDAKCSAPRPESVSACTECDRQAWAWHGNLVSTNHDTCNAYMILYVCLYSLYNYILLQRSRCTVHDYMYTYLYMFRCCFKLTFLRVIRRFCMFKPNISSDLFTSWKSLITYKFTSEFCCMISMWRSCRSLQQWVSSICESLWQPRKAVDFEMLACWQWQCPYLRVILDTRNHKGEIFSTGGWIVHV